MIIRSIRLRKQRLVAPTVAALSALALAGCSGPTDGGAKGEYIGEPTLNSSYAIVAIEGDAVTVDDFYCHDKKASEYTKTGTLNKDRTQVTWTKGGWEGTDQIAITNGSVSLRGNPYVDRNDEAGKAVYDKAEASCPQS